MDNPTREEIALARSVIKASGGLQISVGSALEIRKLALGHAVALTKERIRTETFSDRVTNALTTARAADIFEKYLLGDPTLNLDEESSNE